jgi:hypothetical protein
MTLLVFAALLAAPIGPGYVAPPVALPVEVVTVYHATAGQTDDTPLVTADGTRIVRSQIGNMRLAAVSQELLWYNGGPVRYGDYLWVDVGMTELAGLWRVADTMWEGIGSYVDLLVPSHINECWITEAGALKRPLAQCDIGLSVHLIGGAGR